MHTIRLALLILVLGSLAIFDLQNVSPTLSLVFLGNKSVALQLSVLILVAIAAGALISFLISGLFRVSNYLYEQQLQPRRRRRQAVPVEPEVRRESRRVDENVSRQTSYEPPPPPVSYTVASPSSASDSVGYAAPVDRAGEKNWVEEGDVEDNPRVQNLREQEDEEWEEEEEEFIDERGVERLGDRAETKLDTQPKNYEVIQEPKTGTWSGSIYSYSYRQQELSGEGQTDSVYDANYRIVNPPSTTPDSPYDADYRIVNPPSTTPASPVPPPLEEDDWTTSRNDDDWDWEDNRSERSPRKN